MKSDYQIREYQQGDEEQIVDLLDHVFEIWPTFNISCSKIDYWKWKYPDNPLNKTAIIVAEHDQKIIGCSHGLYKEIKIGEKIYNFQIGGDLAVHPDYRRMGISRAMTPAKIEIWKKNETDLGMMATINPIVKKQRVKAGNRSFPKELLEMRHIFDTSKKDFSFLKSMGYRVLQKSNLIKSRINKFSSSDVEIEKIDRFGADTDVFWEKVSTNYLFAVTRNRQHLNWRYCDPRSGDFDLYAAYHNSDLLGYCVTRVKPSDDADHSGMIVDLITYPDRLDVAYNLVQKAVEGLKEKSVNTIRYLVVKGHPYEDILNRFGFLSRPAFLDISYRIISKRVTESLTQFESAPSERLHLQYGDLDVI